MLMGEIISGALKSVGRKKRASKEPEIALASLAAVEDLLDGLAPTAPSTPTAPKPPSADPGVFEFDSEGNIIFNTVVGMGENSLDFGSAVATEITGYEHAYKRTVPVKWTAEMDALFYQGLSRYGSDLSLLGSLFPTIAYSHIRSKFKKEDKRHPDNVTAALRQAKRRRTEEAASPPQATGTPALELHLAEIPALEEPDMHTPRAASEEEDELDVAKLLDL